jgi:glycerol-1-phosphate dehydrogenase [NAD(P)+]
MIVIPRYTIIKEKASFRIQEILDNLNLKNPLVITGKNTQKYNKDFDFIYYDEIETSDLENIKNYANDYDSII